MNERLPSRLRRREMLITFSFTIFSVLLIIVSAVEDWPLFYIPLVMAELAFVWWSYVKSFKSYLFRAFVFTVLTTINMFLYGIQGADFLVLIPTICTEFVLLSLYEIRRIMDVVLLKNTLLFIYHFFIKGYHFPEDHLGWNRLILHVMSLIVLIGLVMYRMQTHTQEEKEAEDLREQVRREQRIREDFIANTSHEMRTPVNTVSGLSEIMLQKNLPDDVHNSILDIQMTGLELQNIVTDILDYAALESDTLVLHPRVYSITSTLNDVMNMTVFDNRNKQLEIIFDCDPNIPSQLEGDENQLRRILNSLISNAIKYTSEGGVIVRVGFRPEAYGINLIVTVQDTGVGLSPEDQELILRSFYQQDSGRNRKSSGLGLGLPIVSALVKKMGGFLIVKSQEGAGSEFTFSIPQRVVSNEPSIALRHPGSIKLAWYYNAPSAAPPLRAALADHIQHFSDSFGIISHRSTSLEECKRRVTQGQNTHLILGQEEYLQDKSYFDELANRLFIILVADRNSSLEAGPKIHVLYKPYNAMMLAEILNDSNLMSNTLRKKEQRRFIAPEAKILVVDDNLMNLKVVEGLLRKYRIRVVTATSGEEALSLVESKDFDFVFMDHMMPGMDGVECFHRIREKTGRYYTQLPIIALTANAIAGSREMFLAEGFSEFVAKPIDTTILNEILHRFIPLEKQLPEEEVRIPKQAEKTAPAPEEKKRKERKGKSRKAPKEIRTAEDLLNVLPGIDKEYAMTYCGSVDNFAELAQVYLRSGRQYQRDLEKALRDMNLKEYSILAHTIKGTSRTLGLVSLADKAFEQERAAKAERAGGVREHHDSFVVEFSQILNILGSYFGEEPLPETETKQTEKGGPEIQNWTELKARLADCLKSFEGKAFEQTLASVKSQNLNGKPVMETLATVRKRVAAFDFEGALACLEEIGDESC